MNKSQKDEQEKIKIALNLLSVLQNKKNQIIKKYRKKFEELKINQIKNGFTDKK